MTSSVGASHSWKRALPLPKASQEQVTAANAVIKQSGFEECLHGNLSHAIVRRPTVAMSLDIPPRLVGWPPKLLVSKENSMNEMLASSESLLDLLGDQETSH